MPAAWESVQTDSSERGVVQDAQLTVMVERVQLTLIQEAEGAEVLIRTSIQTVATLVVLDMSHSVF
jgi:hypothetical protein